MSDSQLLGFENFLSKDMSPGLRNSLVSAINNAECVGSESVLHALSYSEGAIEVEATAVVYKDALVRYKALSAKAERDGEDQKWVLGCLLRWCVSRIKINPSNENGVYGLSLRYQASAYAEIAQELTYHVCPEIRY